MQSSQHKLKSYDAIPTFYSFYMIILALEVCDGIENRVLVWWSRSSVIRAATAEDVEAEKEMIEMDAVRQKSVWIPYSYMTEDGIINMCLDCSLVWICSHGWNLCSCYQCDQIADGEDGENPGGNKV